MKILWSSNAPHVCSGYGIQTRHIIEGLQQLGHDVALAPNFGLQGGAVESGGMHIYPIWRDKIGQDVLGAHAKHFRADLVITLYDLWTYNIDFASRLGAPWAPYFPQDSYPPCRTIVEQARRADYPIAISKFGQQSLAEQGVDCHYIPHGVDVQTYRPLNKAECRKELGLPDKFIVLMVAANQSFPSRKAFPENLAAFAKFHKAHPETHLFLHTTRKARGAAWDGVELDLLIQALGIEDCTSFVNEYALMLGLPEADMAKVYSACDVLLSASMGEGFGVPIIEAQACGLPVITTDFTAMPEITFNGAKVQPLQESWTALNTWQALPPIAGIHQALEMLYEQTAEYKEQASKAGRERVIKEYSWPVVMEQWRAFLEKIETGEKPSQERLYNHVIKDIPVDVYDDRQSFTTGCVASELEADRYGLEKLDLQPGDVILDIGAHVGTFAIYCAKRWPGVKVYSYEPSQTNYDRFIRALAETDITTVNAFRVGITSNGRNIEIALDRGNTGGTSEFVKPNGHLRESAPSQTLDDIVSSIEGRIKLLKIDAEGAEHEILLNATCLDRIDHIAGEFHINAALEAKGYSIAGLYHHLRNHLPADRIIYSSCQMSE